MSGHASRTPSSKSRQGALEGRSLGLIDGAECAVLGRKNGEPLSDMETMSHT